MKIEAIDKYITSLSDKDKFSGAVLIAKEGKVLLKKSFGYAHIGLQIKNNVNTKFAYASIAKSFTAIAILQLKQAGKLSLNDNIGMYLPEYPNQIVRDSITIKHLLTHTSGLPHYFGDEKYLNAPNTKFRTLDDLSSLYEKKPLEFNPGSSFAYRNTNYLVLGRIIEKVSGHNYDRYIEENIYSIAHMKNTGNFDKDHVIKNKAENYTLSTVYPGKYQKAEFFGSRAKGNADGGGFSTVDDLYLFVKALKSNKLLDDKHTQMYLTSADSARRYGFGIEIRNSNNNNGIIYGHSGGHYGTGCEWRVYDQKGYVVILLTNKDQEQGFLDVRFFIQQQLDGTSHLLDKYFFTKKVVNIYIENGYEKAIQLIDEKSEYVDETELIMKGYDFLKKGKIINAIDIFKITIHLFPNSSNAFDSLAESYMKNGENQLAIFNYEKSLKLDSLNNNAKAMIKELKN
ncbi:MAG: serine hydrolase [Chitinophagales bacterium]